MKYTSDRLDDQDTPTSNDTKPMSFEFTPELLQTASYKSDLRATSVAQNHEHSRSLSILLQTSRLTVSSGRDIELVLYAHSRQYLAISDYIGTTH